MNHEIDHEHLEARNKRLQEVFKATPQHEFVLKYLRVRNGKHVIEYTSNQLGQFRGEGSSEALAHRNLIKELKEAVGNLPPQQFQ